mmetsp:Transcript_3388/g.9139  ORF Transcript_3388/g.9139 Transcript_3388/m.9139 type:complete len:325 (-) Transcript_3388:223-1197(-)
MSAVVARGVVEDGLLDHDAVTPDAADRGGGIYTRRATRWRPSDQRDASRGSSPVRMNVFPGRRGATLMLLDLDVVVVEGLRRGRVAVGAVTRGNVDEVVVGLGVVTRGDVDVYLGEVTRGIVGEVLSQLGVVELGRVVAEVLVLELLREAAVTRGDIEEVLNQQGDRVAQGEKGGLDQQGDRVGQVLDVLFLGLQQVEQQLDGLLGGLDAGEERDEVGRRRVQDQEVATRGRRRMVQVFIAWLRGGASRGVALHVGPPARSRGERRSTKEQGLGEQGVVFRAVGSAVEPPRTVVSSAADEGLGVGSGEGGEVVVLLQEETMVTM